MDLTRCTVDTDVLSNLADEPALTGTEMKAKFDKEADDLKTYINNTLLPEIESLVSTTSSTLMTTVNNLIAEKNQAIYHVGKILMTTENINPATYLGFGTWQLWGSGRVPVGVNTSDNDFKTSEKTGGAKSVTLNINQIPSHNHKAPSYNTANYNGDGSASRRYPVSESDVGAKATWYTSNTGGGQAHNNLQPYITCYMWKRVS